MQWRVWCPACGDVQSNADLMLAPTAKKAAENWAGHLDNSVVDAPIGSGRLSLEIYVTPVNAPHEQSVWTVSGKMMVQYEAVKAV